MESPGHIFERLKVCLLVPTFNNAKTLEPLLKELEKYGAYIILINDGSTDETEGLVTRFPNVQIISYYPNRGKGYALRQGFRAATEKGYDYAISIDSDGQHFPGDLPLFLEKLESNPGALIIGARNMEQSSVPAKSSFGHRFSNFWYQRGNRYQSAGYSIGISSLSCMHVCRICYFSPGGLNLKLK